MTPKTRVALLDVNVLLALAWPNHEFHQPARDWFAAYSSAGWATTPMTECGFVRISANRRALPTSTTPALAGQLLAALRDQQGHRFWPDTIEFVTRPHLKLASLQGHRQVTDAHLLALCVANDGVLATFDTGIADLAGDPASVEVIDVR